MERLEELQQLRRSGVRLAQGFLFARPEHPRPEARLAPLSDAPAPAAGDAAER